MPTMTTRPFSKKFMSDQNSFIARIQGIIGELEAKADEAAKLQQWSDALSDADRSLANRRKDLEKERIAFKAEKDQVAREQVWLADERRRLREKELQAEAIQKKLDDVNLKIRSVNTEMERLTKLRKDVEEKQKGVDALNDRARELDHREALLKKESLIAAKRAGELEAWEQRNAEEAKRLQTIAEQLGKR